jgi:hypothetical protein
MIATPPGRAMTVAGKFSRPWRVTVRPAMLPTAAPAVIHQAELSTMTGWSVTYPNTLAVFSDDTAPGLSQQPAFLHGDVSVAADTRDYPGHPTRGGLYRVTAASYADRNYGRYSFRRYEADAAQFVPLVADKWILALHAWEVFSDTSRGTRCPSTSCRVWAGRTRCAGTTITAPRVHIDGRDGRRN